MKEMSRYLDTPIGSYRPGKLVGVGPVSRVYLIERQSESERQLVLKLFEAVPLDQLEAKDQALDEVRLLACLEHPAILPIVDDGIHAHMLYLVEPYSEGGSLRQRLTSVAGELLPLKEVMALLRQVGEALQFAHTQGIVHANLKPENILFQSDGKALLSDFLLPSLVKSARAARILSTFAALYMAPEQFQGAATPLSDQYAFACLAYELLTGRPPFAGDDFMSLARKHATQEPLPPSQLQPRRAQHIDHVLLKALVKQPAGRYPDMQTFFEELSAPPPLVALSSMPESILGVAQPPAVASDPPPAVPSHAVDASEMSAPQEAFPAASAASERKTPQELSQEMLPAALAVFDAETTQEPQEVLPARLEPDVHEVTTIVIPAAAMPGSAFGADQRIEPMPAPIGLAFGADRQGLGTRQANLPARVRATTHFSRRQVWLTVVLVALAMLISISGIALFFNLASNHPQGQQSHAGGATTLSSPTSQPGQTPTGTTGATAGVAAVSSPTATATHKPKPTPKPSPTSAKPTPKPSPTRPTVSPTATATAAASPSCRVVYQLSSQWSNGFVANLTITNAGSSTIQGWSLVFTFPAKEMIISGWNGHFTQNGEQVTITNDSSNPTLAPGASVTPGFQAISSQRNTNNTPGSFALNGVTCR